MRDFIITIYPAFKKKQQLIVISESKYGNILKTTHNKKDFTDCICPVCTSSLFTYHGQYQKYYYLKLILIIRVKCLICGCTHALIPEFSLPGTSIGTYEADKYLKLRRNNVSQKKASRIFTDLGMSPHYGIDLEKKYKLANKKAMILFTEESDILHNPSLLYHSEDHQDISVILKVNYLNLNRGCNPLYFSRNNILRIREIKTGNRLPLNKKAVWSICEKLDSS
jgi:hypothetical protein